MQQGSRGEDTILQVRLVAVCIDDEGAVEHSRGDRKPRTLLIVRMQVPVGTTVRLLDKVFAKQPRLKDNHLWEHLASQTSQSGAEHEAPDSLPEPEVDETVSTGAAALAPAFAVFRRWQQDAGRPERPLTLDGIVALDPADGRDAKRRCVLNVLGLKTLVNQS